MEKRKHIMVSKSMCGPPKLFSPSYISGLVLHLKKHFLNFLRLSFSALVWEVVLMAKLISANHNHQKKEKKAKSRNISKLTLFLLNIEIKQIPGNYQKQTWWGQYWAQLCRWRRWARRVEVLEVWSFRSLPLRLWFQLGPVLSTRHPSTECWATSDLTGLMRRNWLESGWSLSTREWQIRIWSEEFSIIGRENWNSMKTPATVFAILVYFLFY